MPYSGPDSLTEDARERLQASHIRARMTRVASRLLGRPASESIG